MGCGCPVNPGGYNRNFWVFMDEKTEVEALGQGCANFLHAIIGPGAAVHPKSRFLFEIQSLAHVLAVNPLNINLKHALLFRRPNGPVPLVPNFCAFDKTR